MNLEGTMLSEISYRKKNTAGFHSYVEYKKLTNKQTINQLKQKPRKRVLVTTGAPVEEKGNG